MDMKPQLMQCVDILELVLGGGAEDISLSLVVASLTSGEPAVVLIAEATADTGALRKGNIRPLAVMLHDDLVDLVVPPQGEALTAMVEPPGRPDVRFHRHDLTTLDDELQTLTNPPSKENT